MVPRTIHLASAAVLLGLLACSNAPPARARGVSTPTTSKDDGTKGRPEPAGAPDRPAETPPGASDPDGRLDALMFELRPDERRDPADVVRTALGSGWTLGDRWAETGRWEVRPSTPLDCLQGIAARDTLQKAVASAEAVCAESILDPRVLDDTTIPEEFLGLAKRTPQPEDADWHLRHTKVKCESGAANCAHSIATGLGRSITICHPDTGWTKHRETFTDRLLREKGRNFVESGTDLELVQGMDPLPTATLLRYPGHGTASSSVIFSGLGGPDAAFVSGAAPEAKLIPIRVGKSVAYHDSWPFSWIVESSPLNLARGIRYAVQDGSCQIISISLGMNYRLDELEGVVRSAISKGLIVIAAAGQPHGPMNGIVYPAAFAAPPSVEGHGEAVVAVGGMTRKNRPWSTSMRGPQVTLSAPAQSIVVAEARPPAKPEQWTVEFSDGTTFAAALTAGVAALWLDKIGFDNVKEAYPELVKEFGNAVVPCAFKEALVAFGHLPPVGWTNDEKKGFGVGSLNAYRLLSESGGLASEARVKSCLTRRQPERPMSVEGLSAVPDPERIAARSAEALLSAIPRLKPRFLALGPALTSTQKLAALRSSSLVSTGAPPVP